MTGERPAGGFAAVYRVLSAFEDVGRAQRGYFVESLGAAQFAVPGAVDRLRAIATAQRDAAQAPSWAPQPSRSDPGIPADGETPWAQAAPGRRGSAVGRVGGGPAAVVLAATDPANPFGAALAWPDRPGAGADAAAGHRPGRKAGALVVLVDGEPVLYVERGGRSLLSWTAEEHLTGIAVGALARAVVDGSLSRLTVEKADGEPIAVSGLGTALERAGFHPTPRGLRLRA